MTSSECRAKALECYQVAKKSNDPDVRRAMLALVVQWRELAEKMDRLKSDRAALIQSAR
jgi:hypothetical protein